MPGPAIDRADVSGEAGASNDTDVRYEAGASDDADVRPGVSDEGWRECCAGASADADVSATLA